VCDFTPKSLNCVTFQSLAINVHERTS
jgi:hypothetical protein